MEVSGGDSRLLAGITLEPSDDSVVEHSGVLNDFIEWETSLRNDLVRVRASLTARDPQPWIRPGETVYETLNLAHSAGRIDSPLEAEDFLDRARWKKIDELASGEYFNIRWLEGYALKLRILLRRSLFDRERGRKRYDELYEEILKKSDTEFTSGEFNG
jgi:hypothetical protein